MKKAILFDLDGTVLDSKPGIFRSAAYALGKLSLPMPDETAMMEFLGPPLSDGFATVCHVPQKQIEEAVRLYREYYNSGGKFEASIYNGLRELLISLQKQGKCCCITTSKPHVFAREILEHFGMAELFNGIYGSEFDGTRGRKSEVVAYCLEQQGLTAADVILVGDRHFDVNGAKMLGIPCVAVLYGYGNEEELRGAEAAYIVRTTTELRDLLVTL